MIKKREKYLTFATIFFITLSITNAITNVTPQGANLQIIGFSEKISPAERHEIFINESEFYKNRKRTFEVGLPANSFVPQPRKGLDSVNYFKSLNLAGDYIYALMQFETLDGDPKREQMDLLAKDNITLFEYHGDHTYYTKIPRTIIETKSYDFVRWIGIIDDSNQKINNYLINLINTTNGTNINVTISPYEKFNNILY